MMVGNEPFRWIANAETLFGSKSLMLKQKEAAARFYGDQGWNRAQSNSSVVSLKPMSHLLQNEFNYEIDLK